MRASRARASINAVEEGLLCRSGSAEGSVSQRMAPMSAAETAAASARLFHDSRSPVSRRGRRVRARGMKAA